jgi:hypothetical protein
MRPAEDIERLIKKSNVQTSAETDKKILGDALEGLERLKQTGLARTRLSIWRIIMKSPIIKLAAAAVIVIAALLGIYFVTGKTPEVTCCAWAQLADKVAQIDTCIYYEHSAANVKTPSGGKPKNGAVHYLSTQYGYRVDNYVDGKITEMRYLLPEEKVMITIEPLRKQCVRMLLKDQDIVQFRMNNKDPRYLLRKFIQSRFSEIGSSVIDGVEVKGIEVNNPEAWCMYDKFKVRVWVDVRTELPVRMEMEIGFPAAGQPMQTNTTATVMDNFEWGVPLGPDVFKPYIPADYTLRESLLPGQDEAAAIDGLRKFVELTDGNYPSHPNGPTIRRESWPGIEKKHRPIKPNKQLTKEQIQARFDESIKLQGFIDFYMKLAQEGNEPTYYGDRVTVADANTILMRWKINDSEYRVIYGNLRAETVTADKLAKLEKALPQR